MPPGRRGRAAVDLHRKLTHWGSVLRAHQQGGVILAGHGHHIGWAMVSGRRAGDFAALRAASRRRAPQCHADVHQTSYTVDWTDRLRLRNLQMLLSLARSSNMSHSAEELHTTQPNLSKWLKELEEDVGLPLFERRARGIRPTSLWRSAHRTRARTRRPLRKGSRRSRGDAEERRGTRRDGRSRSVFR